LKRSVRQLRPGRFFLHRNTVVPMLQRGGTFGMVRRDSPIKGIKGALGSAIQAVT